jgi:hypothetical protein
MQFLAAIPFCCALRKGEALMAAKREKACWTVQTFFNNEKTHSASAAEEGWTRTAKQAAPHHSLIFSAHSQSL